MKEQEVIGRKIVAVDQYRQTMHGGNAWAIDRIRLDDGSTIVLSAAESENALHVVATRFIKQTKEARHDK